MMQFHEVFVKFFRIAFQRDQMYVISRISLTGLTKLQKGVRPNEQISMVRRLFLASSNHLLSKRDVL